MTTTDNLPALPEPATIESTRKFSAGQMRAYGAACVAASGVAAPACRIADVGFRWDGEAQHHVPSVLVEFEPVPANSPCDAKGWKDRDALVALLATRSQPVAADAPAEVRFNDIDDSFVVLQCAKVMEAKKLLQIALQPPHVMPRIEAAKAVLREAVSKLSVLAAPVEVQGAILKVDAGTALDAFEMLTGRQPTNRNAHLEAMVRAFLRAALAGRPAPAAEADVWQPLKTAPDGVRVLLGPRDAPVVGIVRQMPHWADEQEPVCNVVHYNGSTLVANYRCSEWAPLYTRPAAPLSEVPTDEATDAGRDVLSERARQIASEGWTPAHDDKYRNRELVAAAECYAGTVYENEQCPAMWPWPVEWWKPSKYRRNLVKAGALILAEIERLDRAALRPTPSNERG
jgi:hypothetical protein